MIGDCRSPTIQCNGAGRDHSNAADSNQLPGEARITILPFWLNLDAISVIRLSSLIVSLFIAIFLFRLKSRSVPTLLLAWAFAGGSLLNLSSFLEFASPYYWQPYNVKNLLIPFTQVIGPGIAGVSLVLFAYHFPHFQKPDRKEFRIVLSLCVAANLATVIGAFFNFIVLSRGHSDFSLEQAFYIFLYAVLGSEFFLTVFLLFRKAVRFSGGKRRPWWRRLIRSTGSDALAARSLALVLCLPAVAVGGYVLMTVGVVPFHLATYFIWLVFILFYFSFIVTYLNHTVEQTTFQVKLIGLAFVFIVGILGLVSMVIGRSYAQEYTNRSWIGENRTIHYQPNRYGSYTITGEELRFDTDLGEIVEIPVGAIEAVTMSFPFPFFGKLYQTAHVLHGPMIFLGEKIVENGWGGYHPQPTIAALLVNLDPTRGGGIYVKNREDQLTITWYSLPESGYSSSNTVQLALLPDGSFRVTYGALDIRSRYSAIRMYVFTTANLTGQHPGASGRPVPSGPKLIGIHPGGSHVPLRRIRFNLDLPFVSRQPEVIFESYENDFNEYLHSRMSILVIVLVISSFLVLFIFPRLYRTSLIKPLQSLYSGMERVDCGDLTVNITPQFNDEIGALTLYFNRMLQSVQKAEANFRALADNARDGILIVLEQGRIAYSNRSAEQITGRSGSELQDVPVEEVIHPRDRQISASWLWTDTGEQRESKHLEASVLHQGKIGGPVEMTVSKTFWHGTPASVVMLRDISERKRREEQDRQYQQRMIQTDKLTTLGILAGEVAHEISNPNEVILANSGILNRAWSEVRSTVTKQIADTEQYLIAGFPQEEFISNLADWLENIEANSKKIDSIVKEMKSFLRNEPQVMSSVNLTAIVQSAVELMNYHIRRATDNFSLHLENTIPNIRGNAQQLEQVVINLIMNACQALSSRDGAVEICTATDPVRGSVLLTIRDEGCGISEADLQRVTDLMFTTKQETGGIGLGLYITDTIVKEHGGTLSFVSVPGSGTEVVVNFPMEGSK